MSIIRTLVTDRTGLLGAGAGLLAQLPPEAVVGYMLARILLPVLLIAYATRGATTVERVQLVSAYLTGAAGPQNGRGPRSRRR